MQNRRQLEHRDLRGFHGEIGATEIVGIATGVGMKRARTAAQRAFELYPDAEIAIGTGVAGALIGRLKPGDLMLAERVIVHRDEQFEPEDLGAIDQTRLREIGESLQGAGIAYASGAILTSYRVLPRGTEKRRATETTGAIAVDMETASIAEEAGVRGIPFVCLRAIIDEVDDEVVGPKLDRQGNIRPLATAVKMLRNPGALLQLPRMMTNLGRATRSLAGALEVIVRRGDTAATHESAVKLR